MPPCLRVVFCVVLFCFILTDDPAPFIHSFIHQNRVDYPPGPGTKLETSNTAMNRTCSVLEVLVVHSVGRGYSSAAQESVDSIIKKGRFCWLQTPCSPSARELFRARHLLCAFSKSQNMSWEPLCSGLTVTL